MKEFKHTTGGRYDYSEDIHSLQDYANALNSIFTDCGNNFVLNGCKVNGTECSEGYVWLNGKIRYVPSAKIDLQDNEVIYIEAVDSNGNIIDYGDGSKGAMNISYGAKYSHALEADIDDTLSVLIYSDGEFLNLRSALFEHYALTKYGKKQIFQTPLQINGKVRQGSMGKYFTVYNGDYEIRFNGYEMSFYQSGSCVYKYMGPEFEQYGEQKFILGSDKGEIDIPSMQLLRTVTSKTNIDVTDKICIGGTDIKEIFAYTNYPIDTGWKKLINPQKNTEINTLLVRQLKEVVMIKGVIPREYVVGFNDEYVTVISKQSENISDSAWVVYKLNIKLPNGITAPNANRIPGCVLSSNYQATENLSCNNVELHIGTDNYLYIIGKPVNMNWYSGTFNGFTCTGPFINFNYLID